MIQVYFFYYVYHIQKSCFKNFNFGILEIIKRSSNTLLLLDKKLITASGGQLNILKKIWPIFCGLFFNTLRKILSKNNLARLGNLEKRPSQEEIQDYHKSDNNISQIMNISDKKQQIKEIHSLAKNQINSANLDLAIKTVFSVLWQE